MSLTCHSERYKWFEGTHTRLQRSRGELVEVDWSRIKQRLDAFSCMVRRKGRGGVQRCPRAGVLCLTHSVHPFFILEVDLSRKMAGMKLELLSSLILPP